MRTVSKIDTHIIDMGPSGPVQTPFFFAWATLSPLNHDWTHFAVAEWVRIDPLVLRVCSAASSSVRVNSLTRRLLFIHPTFHDLDQMHRLFWWILMTLTVNQVQPDQFNRYRSIWVNLAHVKNRIWSWLGFKNIWLITSTFPNPSIRISIFCMKFPIFPWIWLTGVPGEKSMIEPHCGAHW